MQALEHVPNLELDYRLLEATRDTATESLERHLKVKEKHSWFVEDYVSADDLVILLPHRHDVELEQGVGEAVEVFTHTEDGVIWYPRDVRKICHPSESYPTGNDNDPHEAFSRY